MKKQVPPLWAVAVVALVIAFIVMATTGGCSTFKIEGDCHYARTVTTSYTCEPGSSMEHKRLAPAGTPEP